MVGEVDHDAFGGHPERRGDDLEIEGVDEVDQTGAAEHPGWDAAGVQDMADIGAGGWSCSGFGSAGDHEVRVFGGLGVSVGEAPLDDGPARRIERDRVRPPDNAQGPIGMVEVVDPEAADLQTRQAMNEAEDPEKGLVRVSVAAAGPAAEQSALLIEIQSLADETAGLLGGQSDGRVHQDDPLAASEGEELAQHGEPTFAALGQDGQEGLDVVDIDDRPVGLSLLGDKELSEVADGGQGGLDGLVGAGQGSGPESTFPGAEHVVAERRCSRPKRLGHRGDATVAPTCCQAFSLIRGQREAMAGEESFEGAGQRSHRSARTA